MWPLRLWVPPGHHWGRGYTSSTVMHFAGDICCTAVAAVQCSPMDCGCSATYRLCIAAGSYHMCQGKQYNCYWRWNQPFTWWDHGETSGASHNRRRWRMSNSKEEKEKSSRWHWGSLSEALCDNSTIKTYQLPPIMHHSQRSLSLSGWCLVKWLTTNTWRRWPWENSCHRSCYNIKILILW